jgi:hypothetical protein
MPGALPHVLFCRTCMLRDPRLPELWPASNDLPRPGRDDQHDDARNVEKEEA